MIYINNKPLNISNILIFGNGNLANIMSHYLSLHMTKFVVDKEFLPENHNLLSSTNIMEFSQFNISGKGVVLPVGYHEVNGLRQRKFQQVLDFGGTPLTYIHRSVDTFNAEIGNGCWIQEQCSLQPNVKIGNGVVKWANSHTGHGSIVEDFCWITTNSTICGDTIIGERSFIGANSVIFPNVKVGKRNIIAAGAIITKDTEDDAVYLEGRNNKISKKSWEIKL